MKGNIRERLYHLETPPPEGVWERIALQLDGPPEENRSPVIALPVKKRTNWQRIALAAALIGFVATTALWLSERNKKPEKVIVRETVPAQKLAVPESDTTRLLPQPGKENINNGNNELTVAEPVKQNPPPDRVIQNGDPVANRRPRTVVPVLQQEKQTNPVYVENRNLPEVIARDSAGKAIQDIGVVRTQNGTVQTGPVTPGDKAIAQILSRISVKGDNEELDRVISESPYWKAKIQEWRNKLIRSGYQPSAVNMMDMLTLLKLMEAEEKKP